VRIRAWRDGRAAVYPIDGVQHADCVGGRRVIATKSGSVTATGVFYEPLATRPTG